MPYKDPEKRKAYNRRPEVKERNNIRNKKRYAENRNTILSKRRNQYKEDEKTRERISVEGKAWRDANKDTISIKNKDNYNKNPTLYNLRAKQYRETNPEVALNYRASERTKWVQWFTDLGYTYCTDCNKEYPFAALDFHHIEPTTKTTDVARLYAGQAFNARNIDRVKEELSKCVCVCRNCHAEYRALPAMSQQQIRKEQWYIWLKNNGYGECFSCGFDKSMISIDYHHINMTEKEYAISRLIKVDLNGNKKSKMREALYNEIKKCIPLCSSCHAVLHTDKVISSDTKKITLVNKLTIIQDRLKIAA